MKLPKINWLTVASFMVTIVGGVITEVRHQQELQETKDELKQYIDNGCVDPPEEE